QAASDVEYGPVAEERALERPVQVEAAPDLLHKGGGVVIQPLRAGPGEVIPHSIGHDLADVIVLPQRPFLVELRPVTAVRWHVLSGPLVRPDLPEVVEMRISGPITACLIVHRLSLGTSPGQRDARSSFPVCQLREAHRKAKPRSRNHISLRLAG